MGDLTPRRRAVVSSDEGALKQRRIELQVHVLRGEIMRTELEICEMEQTIEKRKASIDANEAEIARLTGEISQQEGGEA